VLGVGVPDPVEEPGADDAAAAPDRRHRAEVEVPVVGLRRGAHLREALRVGDDLARVQRQPDVLDQVVAVAPWPGLGPASVVDAFLRSPRSADSPRANTASVMPGQRHAQPEARRRGPGAGALLLGLVNDHVDQRAAGLLVGLRAAPSR
jgi:hypothetical protein